MVTTNGLSILLHSVISLEDATSYDKTGVSYLSNSKTSLYLHRLVKPYLSSNIRALVLLNLLNSLRKRDKMLGKPRILSLFPNWFNKFN